MYFIINKKRKTVFIGAVELVFEFSNFEFNVAIWVILEKFCDWIWGKLNTQWDM